MIAELMRSTTIQMLLLALLAGVCLGGAIIGTGANLVLHRTGASRPWIAWTAGASGLTAAVLIALVAYVGMTTTYMVSSS